MIAEKQLQDQINSLRKQVNEQKILGQREYFTLTSILYSGDNVDLQGNRVPNPSLFSLSRFIKHDNVDIPGQTVYEQIMIIGQQQGYWQSLSYPGEYVKINNKNEVIERINQTRQFYANFDYRFCPTEYRRIDTSRLQEDKIRQVKEQIDRLKNLQSGWFQMLYGTESMVGTDTDHIFENMSIVIGYDGQGAVTSGMRPMGVIKNKSVLIKTEQQLKDVLVLTQLLIFLKKLRELRPLYAGTEKVTVNILQEALNNVYLYNVKGCYMKPEGLFRNIYIIDSENVQLLDNQNVYIQNCKNVVINGSYNQGKVTLNNVQNFYADVGFCGEQGSFYLSNSRLTDSYFYMGPNSCTSGQISLTNLDDCQFIAEKNSLSYSNVAMLNMVRSQIIFNEDSAKSSQFQIQQAFNEGFLELNSECCNNGDLIIKPLSFQRGVLSFVSLAAFGSASIQRLQCPQKIQFLYTKLPFVDFNILEGSSVIVQDSVLRVNELTGTFQYDNGPFDLDQALIILRENKYMQTQLPGTIPYSLSSTWLGYQLKEEGNQMLDDWNYLQLDRENQNLLTVETVEKIEYIFPFTYEFRDSALWITCPEAQNCVVRGLRLNLSIDQAKASIGRVFLNGQGYAEFHQTKYDIQIQECACVDLSLNLIDPIALKISGGQQIQWLRLGVNDAQKLSIVDISKGLISVLVPGEGLFRNSPCKTLHLILASIQTLSDQCFAGTSIQGDIIVTVKKVQKECFLRTEFVGEFQFPNVTDVRDSAFKETKGKFAMSFPSLNRGGRNQFVDSIGLQKLSVKEAPEQMCAGCKSLIEVDVNGVYIGPGAFVGCEKLQRVQAENVVKIYENTFGVCGSLTKIELPACDEVGFMSFSECRKLKSVSIPVCLILRNQCFQSCVLMSINCPRVQQIGYKAFSGCSLLTELFVPDLVRIEDNGLEYMALNEFTIKQEMIIGIEIFKQHLPGTFTIRWQKQEYIQGLENISTSQGVQVIVKCDSEKAGNQLRYAQQNYPQKYYNMQIPK